MLTSADLFDRRTIFPSSKYLNDTTMHLNQGKHM